MSRLSAFSTMLTWNWRGSSRMALAESSVVTNQLAGSGAEVSTGAMRGLSASRVSSPKPPNRPQTTKAPTARNATSLTTDSTAMARISPF